MRWATVGSETRNARAISSVASPPSKRSVSARAPRRRAPDAGREHEAQEVVAHFVVKDGIRIRRRPLPLDLVTELFVFAFEQLVSSKEIDRTMLCCAHEPGARIARDSRLRPLLERGDQSILRELLGQAHVAHDPCETRDEPRRFDPPDRVDGADVYR